MTPNLPSLLSPSISLPSPIRFTFFPYTPSPPLASVIPHFLRVHSSLPLRFHSISYLVAVCMTQQFLLVCDAFDAELSVGPICKTQSNQIHANCLHFNQHPIQFMDGSNPWKTQLRRYAFSC